MKHKKAVIDAQKSVNSGKISKSITAAVKQGGPDPSLNLRLAAALQGAKTLRVPKATVEAAIARGVSPKDGSEGLVFNLYEGLFPESGIAVLIETMTDNQNRTVAHVKSTFRQFGGIMTSVKYLFEEVGEIQVQIMPSQEEELFDDAVEAGALDIINTGEDNFVKVITSTDKLSSISKKLQGAGYKLQSIDTVFNPCSKEKLVAPDEAAVLDSFKRFRSHLGM